MLTATDLTGEETQDKKNPRFLLLMLALFIMAGIGYAAFWWIQQKETIVPIVKEEQVVDESAQAWYEEQKKLMEAQLNISPITDSANHNDSALHTATPVNDSATIAEAAPTVTIKAAEAAPAIDKPAVVKPTEIEPSVAKPTVSKPAVVVSAVGKPTLIKPAASATSEMKPARIRASYPLENTERAEAPRIKPEKRVDDNIRSKSTIQYWDEQTIQQTYNGSIPPTNNRRPASQYIYSEPVNNNTAPPKNDFASVMITREELEEFMRQFPYKKTTIQFVTYNRPTEGTEAIKAQIIQFLRQQGYTDIEVNWNIWSDYTPVREVHYGKYGLTGACFYIPVLK